MSGARLSGDYLGEGDLGPKLTPRITSDNDAMKAHGAYQEDRHAGCPRTGHPAAQRHSTGGVDPTSELRDQRELLRLRIFVVRLRTRVKNRIHGTLSCHNIQVPGADLFGVAARMHLGTRLPELPLHSREAIEQELATLDFLEIQIESAEQRLEAIMKVSMEADLLKTLPV